MNNPMTPSRVLEEYDIVGRDISGHLIEEVRLAFAKLETAGVHAWEILCTEALVGEYGGKMRSDWRSDVDQSYIRSAISDVLLENVIEGKRIKRDGMNWKQRVAWCNEPRDYQCLFDVLGARQGEWINSSWLISNGYEGLCRAIVHDDRFGSWDNFLIFMRKENMGYEIIRIKNRHFKQKDGYVDVNIKITKGGDDDLVKELLIIQPEMANAKNGFGGDKGIGHNLYEAQRQAEILEKAEGSNPFRKRRIERVREIMKKVYEEAYRLDNL